MSELTPQHVLTDLFDSDDFVPPPDPERAVLQRLINAGFEIRSAQN